MFCRDTKAETYVVETCEGLNDILCAPHSELVFVESVMDKYDSPADLIIGGHLFGNLDYGPRGPQTAPDARLPLPAEFAGRGI